MPLGGKQRKSRRQTSNREGAPIDRSADAAKTPLNLANFLQCMSPLGAKGGRAILLPSSRPR
jgi:hypothetical protein